MAKHTLLDEVKITKIMNSTVGTSGTTNLLSTALDMFGYDSVLFLINWGAIGAGGANSAYVTGADTSSGTYTAHDLTGSRVTVLDTDDDKVTAINITRPPRRWAKVGIFRDGSNASTVESIVAIQYRGAHAEPITQPTGSVQGYAKLVTPTETTLVE